MMSGPAPDRHRATDWLWKEWLVVVMVCHCRPTGWGLCGIRWYEVDQKPARRTDGHPLICCSLLLPL